MSSAKCQPFSTKWLVTASHQYSQTPRGWFTSISRVPQNNLAKIYNARNHFYVENFKLKLCKCAQSMASGICTKFQLEILIRITISAIHKVQENLLESSQNNSETTPPPPPLSGNAPVDVPRQWLSQAMQARLIEGVMVTSDPTRMNNSFVIEILRQMYAIISMA